MKAAWRRFFRLFAGSAAAAVAALFVFVAVIDPWGVLPASPTLARVPVTTSSRYAFPMLARASRFDSVVVGTSTSRLLRPAALDRAFGARFVNLSIDAATAYEETRLLGAFLQAHSRAKFVVIGLDMRWCDPTPQPKYTHYPFPEWMYDRDRWPGYLRLLNLYAVQESGSQLAAMAGWKPARHGDDGYSAFKLPSGSGDPARVAARIAAAGFAAGEPGDPSTFRFTTLWRLRRALAAIPPGTRKLLFFVPYYLDYQQPQGGPTASYWAGCKRRVARMAAADADAEVVDFMIASPITRDEANYYDAIHFRPTVADRIADDLAQAARGRPSSIGDYRIISQGAAGENDASRPNQR